MVFGAAEYFGRPSPVYRARLDHAFELYERKLAPVVITTGGSGGETPYQRPVGHDYLVGRGIGDPHLIAETQSDNSAESAQRVAKSWRPTGMRLLVTLRWSYPTSRPVPNQAAAGGAGRGGVRLAAPAGD